MTELSAEEAAEEVGVELGLPRPQNTYEVWQTSSRLEKEGIWFDIIYSRYKLAFAGITEFEEAYSEAMRPLAEAQARGLLDRKTHNKILAKCYADHVMQDWEKVTDIKGEEIPFSHENAFKLLVDLPHLLFFIQRQCNNFANYRSIYAEETAKKS